jgi:hypothetical protein
MVSNLPATGQETALAKAAAPVTDERPPVPASRPISVAFLPLALATFVIVAFAIAAWTFLAAGA